MKASRLAVLLSLMLLAASLTAAAQQHEPASSQAPTTRETLAEEGHEAPVDTHAQFKQSPSVQWLARLTGLPVKAAYWVAVVFNFAILVALLRWVLRSKLDLPGRLRGRTASIQHSMREAEQASAEANRRLSEVEARLAQLDAEIASMRAAAETDAAGEEARIRAATEDDQRKIVAAAEREIALAAKLARRELKAYAAELAVSLAAQRIQVDGATDQALVTRFVEQLGNGAEPAPSAADKDGQ